MGRLLNPRLGELLDRLTILRLKILHGAPQPGSGALDHFRMEEAQINMLLDRMGYPNDNDVLLCAVKLQQCNAKLWELEDEMAEFSKVDGWGDKYTDNVAFAIANTAVEIWRMNQERNRLIYEINQLTGDKSGPEKL